jgi:hypothetical protein
MVWAKVQQRQSDPPADLFVEIQREVLRQLEEGPYQRLLKSPNYSRSLLTLAIGGFSEENTNSQEAGDRASGSSDSSGGSSGGATGNSGAGPKRNSALRSGRSFARVGMDSS